MKDLYPIDWDDCGYFLQDDAIEKIINYFTKENIGKKSINYKW